MLKQVFDREQLTKALTSSDVWRWDLLSVYADVDTAVDHTVQYWKTHDLSLSSLEAKKVKGKTVFVPATMEDAFAIKLVDRFIRRIYKVRQSDRNRIVKQLITLLTDSGNYQVLRLDIKDCYESINFERLINKFEDELILAPDCISLLNSIRKDLATNHSMYGLPRGLSISPTLAELYLEKLDNKIASDSNILYSSRYVDDIVVITPDGKEKEVQNHIEAYLTELGLTLNHQTEKYYIGSSRLANFDYLGYSIKVEPKLDKQNEVTVKISRKKLDRLKSKITFGFCDHKKKTNLPLLKRRLEYLSMLKIVRTGRNGDLLGGLNYDYQRVTDDFECLKPIDGYLLQQLNSSRFGLTTAEKNIIQKVSIYGNTKNKKIGKFSKRKTTQIMQAWLNV